MPKPLTFDKIIFSFSIVFALKFAKDFGYGKPFDEFMKERYGDDCDANS